MAPGPFDEKIASSQETMDAYFQEIVYGRTMKKDADGNPLLFARRDINVLYNYGKLNLMDMKLENIIYDNANRVVIHMNDGQLPINSKQSYENRCNDDETPVSKALKHILHHSPSVKIVLSNGKEFTLRMLEALQKRLLEL